jgi:hypothetical protein
MEVSGSKKSIRISLDISPLFFHIVSKLAEALVITYDEIFQALAVEGDVMPPKPFLDPLHSLYSPDLAPLNFHMFGKLKNISKAGVVHLMTPSKPRSRSHFCASLQKYTAQTQKLLYLLLS